MASRIALVDYGMGNLGSLTALFERLGVATVVWREGPPPLPVDGVIFPGVGSMQTAMAELNHRGLTDPLHQLVRGKVPILGICLGLQLFFSESDEGGQGLGWIAGRVVPLMARRTPHMGWNTVAMKPHPLFYGLHPDSAFYFVHSYGVRPDRPQDIFGQTEYEGSWFPSVVIRPPLVGVQFHPELSSQVGRQLVQNFLERVIPGGTMASH